MEYVFLQRYQTDAIVFKRTSRDLVKHHRHQMYQKQLVKYVVVR